MHFFSTVLLLCFLTAGTARISAQRLPFFTQYRDYVELINPAAFSADFLANDGYYNLTVGISYRLEGLESPSEVPNTQVLQLGWSPRSEGRFQLNLGAYFMKDEFGPTSFTGAFVRLGAFTFATPEFGVLSGGINLGFTQFRLKTSDAQALVSNDILLAQDQRQSHPNLGLGLFYSKRLLGRHDLYIGLSVPQIFELDLVRPADGNDFNTEFHPQYYGLLGANLYLSDFAFLEPSVWIKNLPDAGWHADFNMRYRFRQPLWLGLGYSTRQNLHAEFGVLIQDMTRIDERLIKTRKPVFKIGVGYDYLTSPLPSQLSQAVELNLALLLSNL